MATLAEPVEPLQSGDVAVTVALNCVGCVIETFCMAVQPAASLTVTE